GEKEFIKMAIVGGFTEKQNESLLTPCGACMQIMSEFNPDLELILLNTVGKIITINLKELFFKPFETAFEIATLSAQIVKPYDEFSTLQPLYTFPDLVNKAAPTLKFEYGAYAFSPVFFAISTSSLLSNLFLQIY
ncbi:unnamed protein product, partial [marine sediment metagenome]